MSPYFSPLAFSDALQSIGRFVAPRVAAVWDSVVQVASRIFGAATRSAESPAVDTLRAEVAQPEPPPDLAFRVDPTAGEGTKTLEMPGANPDAVTIHPAKEETEGRDVKHVQARSQLHIHPQVGDTKAAEAAGAGAGAGAAARPGSWRVDFKNFVAAISKSVTIQSDTFLRTSSSVEKKAMNSAVGPRGKLFGAKIHEMVMGELARTPKEQGPLGMEVQFCKAIAKTFNAIDPSEVVDNDLLKLLKAVHDHAERASPGAGKTVYTDVLMLTGYSPTVYTDSKAMPDGDRRKNMATIFQSMANGRSNWGSYLQNRRLDSLLARDDKGDVRYQGRQAILSDAGMDATKELQQAFKEATAAVNNFCEVCYLEAARLLRSDTT